VSDVFPGPSGSGKARLSNGVAGLFEPADSRNRRLPGDGNSALQDEVLIPGPCFGRIADDLCGIAERDRVARRSLGDDGGRAFTLVPGYTATATFAPDAPCTAPTLFLRDRHSAAFS